MSRSPINDRREIVYDRRKSSVFNRKKSRVPISMIGNFGTGTGLDLKSEVKDWIKMRGLEI